MTKLAELLELAGPLKPKKIDLLGSAVWVRELSATEGIDLAFRLRDAGKDSSDRTAILLAAFLCDESATKAFGSVDEAREAMKQLPLSVVIKIVAEGTELNRYAAA